MRIRKPNLFIVGAAKSGTTSLYKYLSQHPSIFFCNLKEPRYFSSRYKNFPHNGSGDYVADNFTIKGKNEYTSLFKNAKDEKIIGEASVDYLYFFNSAYDIKNFSPNAKIIIILRNPIDRAFSAYVHLIGSNRENLTFEEALKQERYRMKNNYEFIWFYKDVGKYYIQVKTYLDVFGKQNVNIILFDEIKKNIKNVMKKILIFLDLDTNYNFKENIKYNISGVPRIRFIHNILTNHNLQKIAKIIFPNEVVRIIGRKLLENNLKRPIFMESTRKELISYFKEDILKLQDLLNYNLSDWLI